MNLSQPPVQGSNGMASTSLSQGPNISLISRTIDTSNALTIIVSMGVGTLILVLILLSAVYAKRCVLSLPLFLARR